MNYLAHLRLSPSDPLLRLGNLLGDFRRGLDTQLCAPLRHGIAQHLELDRFTDAHAAFRRSRARLAPPFARLSGVLVDVFYDHFLARGWSRWGDGRPLRAFADEVYRDLREHRALLTPQLRAASPHMAAQDWLGSYASLAGVDAVLARMAARMRRPSPLHRGGGQLRAHYGALAADFETFFPAALLRAGALHGEPPPDVRA